MKACTPWPSSYSGKQTNPSQKQRKPNTSPLLEKFSQTGSHPKPEERYTDLRRGLSCWELTFSFGFSEWPT